MPTVGLPQSEKATKDISRFQKRRPGDPSIPLGLFKASLMGNKHAEANRSHI